MSEGNHRSDSQTPKSAKASFEETEPEGEHFNKHQETDIDWTISALKQEGGENITKL